MTNTDSRDPETLLRVFQMPAAPPWDQQRAAWLNARHGSPLPIPEVIIDLRRLDPWRPGRAGRFAAAYVRRADVVSELSVTLDVEERPRTFLFRSPATEPARRRQRLIDLTLSALLVLGLSAMGSWAFIQRGENVRALEQAERSARLSLAMRHTALRQTRMVNLLASAGAEGRTGRQLVADLVWVATAKQPNVRLRAIHWQGGEMDVSAQGPVTPFAQADRDVAPAGSGGRAGESVWRVKRLTIADPLFRPPSIVSNRPHPGGSLAGSGAP